MNSSFKKVAVGYGLWVLLNLLVAVFQFGDGGVSSHLVLLFTGFPAALPSLALRNGSLSAVFVSGVLGLAQWCVVAWLYKLWSSKGGATGGA